MNKHNYNKIPDWIRNKVQEIASEEVIVACTRTISAADIGTDKFEQFGLSVVNNKLVIAQQTVLPAPSKGRYSRFNLDGREIVLRNLPKIQKAFTWDVPNFGDPSKGYHSITQYRWVYRRKFEAPGETTITAEAITQDARPDSTFLVKFQVDEILNKTSPKFEPRLLASINLLQENVGAIGVFEKNASLADLAATVNVDWELLPPGIQPSVIANYITAGRRVNTTRTIERIEARRRLLASFNPTNWIAGSSGFRRYFGAKFREDLVVFENVDYGNAVYVMFKDWPSLSQLSRIELQEQTDGFIRIVHRNRWERKLCDILGSTLGPASNRAAA